MTESTKFCTKCKTEKPRTEYHHNRSRRDGLAVHCKECTRSSARKWHEENRECSRANASHWKRVNKDKHNQWNRQWAKRHPDRMREHLRAWRRANPDKARVQVAQRRQRTKNLIATLTPQEWQELLDFWGHKCAYCGVSQSALSYQLHQEHVVPLSQGGGYTANNIVPACRSCNSRKGGRTPEQAGMPLLRLWPPS